MSLETVTLELPQRVYADLQSLAQTEQTNLMELITRIVANALYPAQTTAPTTIIEHRRRVASALLNAGLSLSPSPTSYIAQPISAERREELAQLFATGGPLSELIIAEREER